MDLEPAVNNQCLGFNNTDAQGNSIVEYNQAWKSDRPPFAVQGCRREGEALLCAQETENSVERQLYKENLHVHLIYDKVVNLLVSYS